MAQIIKGQLVTRVIHEEKEGLEVALFCPSCHSIIILDSYHSVSCGCGRRFQLHKFTHVEVKEWPST